LRRWADRNLPEASLTEWPHVKRNYQEDAEDQYARADALDRAGATSIASVFLVSHYRLVKDGSGGQALSHDGQFMAVVWLETMLQCPVMWSPVHHA
jgi:hypothetical protein